MEHRRRSQPTVAEVMPDQKPTTRDQEALDDLADEALAVARSMPSGPAKTEALKKGRLLRKAAADSAGFLKE
jgi:hypothetical protein